MARKKLTKTQKLQNARKYKQIRKEWEKTNKAEDYKYFKRQTLALSEAKDISVKQAAKKVANTEDFVSAAERSRANFIKGLKENFNDTYEELRQLSRNKGGKFASVKDNLVWSKEKNGYILESYIGRFFIDVTNSPEGVDIIALG